MLKPGEYKAAMNAIDTLAREKELIANLTGILDKETDEDKRRAIEADLDEIDRLENEAYEESCQRLDKRIAKIEDYTPSKIISRERIREIRRRYGAECAEIIVNLAIKGGMTLEEPNESSAGGKILPFSRRNGGPPKDRP